MSATAASEMGRRKALAGELGAAVARAVVLKRHVTVNLWLPEEERDRLLERLGALGATERDETPENGDHKGVQTPGFSAVNVNTWPREDA
jgi:hypothetical protein